jgi:predicted nuclease of predicted toxin-antitoxin system
LLFLADESCDFAVVRAHRAADHDVLAIRETSPGVTDDDVARQALREGRVLLTEDKDFGQLCCATSATSPGVALIRYPSDACASLGKSVVAVVDKLGGRIHGRFVAGVKTFKKREDARHPDVVYRKGPSNGTGYTQRKLRPKR